MRIRRQNEGRFLSALARFESCLETPVVPGELPTWIETVRTSAHEVSALLGNELNDTHKRLLRHITREDIELAARVEELETKDEELLARWSRIQAELDQLCTRAEQAEPHEAKLDEQVERFNDEALSFVIDVRRQEKALTTWYMEAINRDRGIGD